MKTALILLCIINSCFVKAQQDSIQPLKAFVGIDVFNPLYGVFTSGMGVETRVSYPLTPKWQVTAEVGYAQNNFNKNSWDIEAEGIYGRLGANWFLSQDKYNPNMGFYLGGNFAFSPYKQTIHRFLIRANDAENTYGTLPKHNASAFWLEPLAGAKVPIRNTSFYIDASVRLKVLAFDTNDYGLEAFNVPGLGVNNSGLGIGANWSIGYLF